MSILSSAADAVSSLSRKPVKFIYQFTYLESNFSSTKSDVNIRLVKVLHAIDRLSVKQLLLYLDFYMDAQHGH